MNEIAKQHNDLIDLPLRKFNASEIDILQALCYKCQEQETNKVVLPFDQIRELSHYQAKDAGRFIEALKETNKKLMGLNFTIGTETEFTQFVLFPTFEVSASNETLTVQVHEQFSYLLNNLSGNYTSLELQESAALRSAYAKAMYKKLRKYRDTGFWRVSLEDFREYLDVPKSYKICDINKRVLHPSIDELKPFFSGLNCTPYYDKKSGRGRPSVAGYEFNFKIQPHTEKKEYHVPVPKIAEKTGWTKLGKYCPCCHKEVWQKHMSNENGEYWLIGHPDFKTGSCRWTSTSFGDALDSEQLEAVKKPVEPQTEEQRENLSKLSSMLKGLFSNGR